MNNATRCSILDLSAKDAEAFLLKDTSYCNFNLPEYIVFGEVLSGVDQLLSRKKLSVHWELDPKECSGVNHIIYSNKDGRYAWRPFQLIHPALYVSLVNEITSTVTTQVK
ncbi:MAG: reverse transcriptase, partial [Candidatus Omnitrophica bacterium]|nr:reverse transcriptase [Candidatus Omnitrophota bacterium]